MERWELLEKGRIHLINCRMRQPSLHSSTLEGLQILSVLQAHGNSSSS